MANVLWSEAFKSAYEAARPELKERLVTVIRRLEENPASPGGTKVQSPESPRQFFLVSDDLTVAYGYEQADDETDEDGVILYAFSERSERNQKKS